MRKRILLIIFLLFFSLQSNEFFPTLAYANSNDQPANIYQDNTLPINPSPQQSPIPTNTAVPQLSLSGTVIQQNTLRTSPVVQKLAKQFYRSDENVHIAINNAQSDSFHVSIVDPRGQKADVSVQQVVNTNDQVAFDISPRVEFHPGKYKLILKDQYGKSSEQDFTWGVLAINMDRSIYTPGQTANLSMAVLNEQGDMVCDAAVTLNIVNQPAGVNDTLSTDNGKITVNKQCQSHNFSLQPDYEASYPLQQTGTYNLTLTAKTANGSYAISDKILVHDSVPFDVERVSATRIYPPVKYPVQLHVTANEDFNGTITETVPQDFTITSSDQSNSYDNLQTVYLNSQKDPANQLAKKIGSSQVLGASTSATTQTMTPEESTLVLPFSGSFPITEGFGSEQTDPTLKAFYEKYGLAGHDGIDFGVPVGTPIRAVDDGNISLAGPGDYGITIIIQHSWGKSYYGHLSKVLVGPNQHVTKGQEIALSGDTGEATGPHLHFGLKPNIPDMLNGYFGKIDPLPYFHLAPDASLAVGTTTQIASAISNEQVLGASTSADLTNPQTVTDTPVATTDSTLVSQIKSQVLGMPATPVNNKVKVLSWHVSLKKGDTISLGYTFKAPQVSPQFYLLGPLTFYPENANNQPVFQEQRQWQIAADAIGSPWYNYSWQYRKQITISHTKINGTVGLDTANKSSGNAGSTATNLSWSHTTGSQSNRLLLVGIATNSNTTTVTSVTFNTTTNLSVVPGATKSCSSACRTELWYVLNPPASTTGTISVNVSAGASIVGGAIMLYGVDQSNPFGTAASAGDTGTTATSFSLPVTTVANQLVIDAVAGGGAGSVGWVNNASQTSLWSDNTRNNGTGSYKLATTTTTTMSWTDASSDNWADVAVPINPAGLTNFPVLINLPSDSSLQANAQSNGNDILFTDSTGQTKLNHEVENYNSGTGELEAWVNVPSLSDSTDTNLYMYYGNPSASSQQNATGVWDSNYLGVWHMSDNAANTTVADSTSVGNTGTNNANTSVKTTTGEIAAALTYNGSSDKTTTNQSGSIKGQSQVTISAWVKTTTVSSGTQQNIYSEPSGTSSTNTRIGLVINGGTEKFELFGRVNDGDSRTTFIGSATSLSTNTWYYVVGVFDSVSGVNHLNINGVDETNSRTQSSFTTTTPITVPWIGGQSNSTNWWPGTIDEVRVSKTARSVGWNQTEYNNQSSPSTFYTVGSVETQIFAPTLDQLMRGGKWFCPASECSNNPGLQPYSF